VKILYIDCFAGISGDMFVGALLDLGLDFDFLKKELKKLGLKGYSLKKVKENRHHVNGTRFIVDVEKQEHGRNLDDIISLINRSRLSPSVKERSIHVFKLLGCAEAEAHGTVIEKVHFHEVGAVDSIIDIVSSVIGMEKLKVDRVYASYVKLGNGTLKYMPLPAPAVVQLLENVPIKGVDRDVEMVTPTGAVLLKVYVDKFGPMPELRIEKVGYGIGTRNDSDLPNALRLYLAEKKGNADSIYVIETNIDDMNPERYGLLMDELFKKGAIDVFWTSIQMKKNRPGILVTVLSRKEKLDVMVETIFDITTSFGIRYYEAERKILDREIKKADGRRVKIGTYKGKVYTIKPEYEDWKDVKIETKRLRD
jgi:uncharacterized protein (TIGR00299 family) protein